MKSIILTLPLLLTLTSARHVYIHPREEPVNIYLHPRQTSDNLQSFTGDLGAAALPITFSGDTTRPFLVNGNTFVNFAAAAQRTCDIQFNKCADASNSKQIPQSVGDCQTQKGMELVRCEKGMVG
jgi:hypothetical protein